MRRQRRRRGSFASRLCAEKSFASVTLARFAVPHGTHRRLFAWTSTPLCRALGGDAAPERIHKICHFLARRLDGRRVRTDLRLLLAQNAHKGAAVMILQHGGIEFI